MTHSGDTWPPRKIHRTDFHDGTDLAILVAGPLGFGVRRRKLSLTLYLVAWATVLPIQTVVVYAQDDGGWSYWLVNAFILAGGVGLNRLGATLADHQATRSTGDA